MPIEYERDTELICRVLHGLLHIHPDRPLLGTETVCPKSPLEEE